MKFKFIGTEVAMISNKIQASEQIVFVYKILY